MKARVISQAHDIAPTVGKAGSPSPRTCRSRRGRTGATPCHCQAARPPLGAQQAGGGLVAALRELLEDRRIQASAFFFAWGGSVVLHGTVLNRTDNPEHVLAGYGLFAIGAALGFLTLSGSDRLGRAAVRAEEVLKGFFQ